MPVTTDSEHGRQWLRDATRSRLNWQEIAMQHPHHSNRILRSLTEPHSLLPHVRLIELPQEMELFSAGGSIDRVIFPHAGIVSIVVRLATGEMIGVAMIGREGVVGGLAAVEEGMGIGRPVVQIAGTASAIDVSHVRDLAERDSDFRATLIRHEQVLLAQSQQSAACNATHPIEARLCRWLLRCRDLIGSDEIFLTQEFIAQMLGVRRTSVTLAARNIQHCGLIKYNRGHIRILNPKGLLDEACECYETVKSFSDRLIGP